MCIYIHVHVHAQTRAHMHGNKSGLKAVSRIPYSGTLEGTVL